MSDVVHTYKGDTKHLQAALGAAKTKAVETDKSLQSIGKKGSKGLAAASKAAGPLKAGLAGGAIAAGALAAGIVKAVQQTIKLANEANVYAKRAAKVGETAEEFQIVERSIGLMTEGTVRADKALGELNKRIGEAKAGNKQYKETFDQLIGDFDEFEKLPAREKFASIADAISNMETRSERASAAYRALGRNGAELLGALEQGGQAWRNNAALIEENGVITNKLAAESEALVDALDLLKGKGRTLKRDGLGPLIPTLTNLADGIRSVMQEAEDTGKIDEFGETFNRVFKETLIPAVATFGKVFTDTMIVLEPALTTLKSLAYQAEAAFLALTGRFKKARDASGDAQQALSDVKDALVEMDERLDENADKWGDLVETMITGGKTAEQLAESEDKVNESLEGQGEAGKGAAAGLKAAQEAQKELIALHLYLNQILQEGADSRLDAAELVIALAEREKSKIRQMTFEQLKNEELTQEQRVDLLKKTAEVVVEIEKQKQAQLEEIRREAYERELEAAQLEAQSRLQIASSLFGSMESLSAHFYQFAASEAEKGSQKAKTAAMVMFFVNKAAAVAQSVVNTGLMVSNALATPAPWPIPLGFGIAAGVAGATQTAVIAVSPPPKFHAGGVVRKARRAGAMADEVEIRARELEGVASHQGMRTIGGPEGLADINAGRVPAALGGWNLNVLKLGNRIFEAQVVRNMRSRTGELARLAREAQPRSLGRRIPQRVGA